LMTVRKLLPAGFPTTKPPVLQLLRGRVFSGDIRKSSLADEVIQKLELF